jgi:mannose-6-phosphate isomerase
MRLSEYVGWLRDQALPFWLARAADAEGVFHETLTLDGTPRPAVELRLRTGMRQVYVFAHAAQLGLVERAPAIDLAERMAGRLRAFAWAPDGRPGWAARFDRRGKVTDDRRDLYDHAFALHALGNLHQATGGVRYLTWIDETLGVIDAAMLAEHGGWAENDRHEVPRRQNPHMHLFEACLALFETTGEARHLARAGEIFGLFRTSLFDAGAGVLHEFFGPAWEVSPEWGSARLDPGHMAEWTWLLRRYERPTGRPVDDLCAVLFDSALRLGRCADGFLLDEVDIDGRPLLDRRRLWPQTEYLKALIVQSVARRDPALIVEAEALLDRLFASYLAGVPAGGWRDQFSLDGRPTSLDIPASTLYHLLVPAAEILRLEHSGGL